MRRLTDPRVPSTWLRMPFIVSAIAAISLISISGAMLPAAARQADQSFSPGNGRAPVIAQGVAALPTSEAVWRTVFTRAVLPDAAQFEPRPLGFVLATDGPILLVDAATGEQIRLGIGEAALVPSDTVQQRSSLGNAPVAYLSIELVATDAAPPPGDAVVLQPGQPFPPPAGLHDLDLLSGTLGTDESFVVPDSGAKNVILVTDGVANVGRPGQQTVSLLAGEAASFSGELEVSAAPDAAPAGTWDAVSFVVAVIGPEVPAPALPANNPTPASTEAEGGATTPAATSGSISLQVFTCPPGMDSATLDPAACQPAAGDFDVTLSGAALPAPLTLIDAATDGITYSWGGLPLGEYVIAEAVLPAGATTYGLAASNGFGNPETGFHVTLDDANPSLAVRIYNFAPA